jgi:hypothetical protein
MNVMSLYSDVLIFLPGKWYDINLCFYEKCGYFVTFKLSIPRGVWTWLAGRTKCYTGARMRIFLWLECDMMSTVAVEENLHVLSHVSWVYPEVFVWLAGGWTKCHNSLWTPNRFYGWNVRILYVTFCCRGQCGRFVLCLLCLTKGVWLNGRWGRDCHRMGWS